MGSIPTVTRRHDIVFHRSGRIDIMARVSRLLSIAKGDVVNVEFRDGEHYLYVAARAADTVGRHRGTCFFSHKGGSNCRAYSLPVCSAILALCNGSEVARLWCGNPVDLGDGMIRLPIITRHIL